MPFGIFYCMGNADCTVKWEFLHTWPWKCLHWVHNHRELVMYSHLCKRYASHSWMIEVYNEVLVEKKAYGMSRSVAAFIFILEITWGWAVIFVLQPLFSWEKFSCRHFVRGWVDQRAHLEKTLKESEVSVASAEMQTPHIGGLYFYLRRGIRNNNREVDLKISKGSSYNTLH